MRKFVHAIISFGLAFAIALDFSKWRFPTDFEKYLACYMMVFMLLAPSIYILLEHVSTMDQERNKNRGENRKRNNEKLMEQALEGKGE